MADTETKLVRISLAAFTRLEYAEVIEVPASMTDPELEELLEQRYDWVEGGEYWDDPDYWERASCSCKVITGEEASFLLGAGKAKVLTPEGTVTQKE